MAPVPNKLAFNFLITVIGRIKVSLQPSTLVTISVTLKIAGAVPAPALNIWLGFWLVEVCPSPKFQFHALKVVVVEDWSVKINVIVPHPEFGEKLKAAMGLGFSVIVTGPRIFPVPPPSSSTV